MGLTAVAPVAQAKLEIDINEGVVEPVPIALPDFLASSPGEAEAARDISNVIRNNLDRSGLFRPLDAKSYIEKIQDINTTPRFADWRAIKAEGLVTGKVTLLPDGRLRVEFRLWDIFGEKQMQGLQFATTPQNYRRVGHLVSDAIYERLTGDKGYFDTRVVFIAESGSKLRRQKRLAIMDQDGFNPSFLTQGDYIVLTPRFSPNSQVITYMSYEGGKPRVYLLDLQSGRREILGDFPGMTFAPRFAPNGQKVLMSLAIGGNTDIYSVDLRTKQRTRLTNDPAIDTAPSFSPDGNRITFESDRSGRQQIYVMNADGSAPQRISQGASSYATPVWSPRGDLIAFTKIEGGRFKIGVIRPDGSGERILSESFLQEGPTWAPNGRVVMYYKQTPSRADGTGGRAQLWAVDLTGKNERQVPTPGDASDPAWSPLQH
ncbi:MAG TPA: Tol-Pal system protein TolB [Alphaproteobacteria bacterium]|nr:Tol-Pal system protein TolB [Alphaproteobacteria bacterium]